MAEEKLSFPVSKWISQLENTCGQSAYIAGVVRESSTCLEWVKCSSSHVIVFYFLDVKTERRVMPPSFVMFSFFSWGSRLTICGKNAEFFRRVNASLFKYFSTHFRWRTDLLSTGILRSFSSLESGVHRNTIFQFCFSKFPLHRIFWYIFSSFLTFSFVLLFCIIFIKYDGLLLINSWHLYQVREKTQVKVWNFDRKIAERLVRLSWSATQLVVTARGRSWTLCTEKASEEEFPSFRPHSSAYVLAIRRIARQYVGELLFSIESRFATSARILGYEFADCDFTFHFAAKLRFGDPVLLWQPRRGHAPWHRQSHFLQRRKTKLQNS